MKWKIFMPPDALRRRDAANARTRTPYCEPTSSRLSRMLDLADSKRVSIGWLIAQLGERSFGLTLLIIALFTFVPGVATLTAPFIAWPAIQMMRGRPCVTLPEWFAKRTVSVKLLERAVRIVAPRLMWVERLNRPRWPTPFQATKRLIGGITLLLGFTMMSPVPLSDVPPALVVMLLAVAYMEEDGVALLVALIAAAVSLTFTAAVVWGLVETGRLLN